MQVEVVKCNRNQISGRRRLVSFEMERNAKRKTDLFFLQKIAHLVGETREKGCGRNEKVDSYR